MQYNKISLILLAAATLTAKADYTLVEPDNSALAQGHWVKIRVSADGIYGFSHERLRELGFSNPEAVNIYGYEPTLMLNHNFASTPSDMNRLKSVNENGRLLFFAKDNKDYLAQMWSAAATPGVDTHRVHAHSKGATYFLSDIDAATLSPAIIEMPDDTLGIATLTTHDALIYHEDDAINPNSGGAWFSGPGIARNGSETHRVTLNKATGSGRLTYMGLISANTTKNYFNVEYTAGVTASELEGRKAPRLYDHYTHQYCMMKHNLQLPDDAEMPFSFDITFTPSSNIGDFESDAHIDFFGLVYDRHNNLDGEQQMTMHFNNTEAPAMAALSGLDENSAWHLWNVTSLCNVKEHALSAADDGTPVIWLPKAESQCPNVVVAFRSDVAQPEPEVVGEVANQNLHAMAVPDLVIVASKAMLDAADIAADFHRELQGVDVAVVDQQQIFNEYGSGNIAPEALRRFFAHLYQRDPNKFKAILLIGSGTYNNATTISDEAPEVVTAQMEVYDKAVNETTNASTDAFFSSFGSRLVTNIATHPYYKAITSGMSIPVGRLPFKDASEVKAYYNKARRYISDPHSYPAAGNIALASDYATRIEPSHMANGEALFAAIPEHKRSLLTVTRAASNIWSVANNTITRKMLLNALERGAGFYAFFGHGTQLQISGMNNSGDKLTEMATVNKQNHPGRYPMMFIGSCRVGAYDMYVNSLASGFVANENGGGIAVVAASRTVFQQNNEELGQHFAKNYYSLSADDYLGKAWMNGHNGHIYSTTDLDKILNTCAYNYLGDPLLPSFATTHSVAFDELGTITAGGSNTLTGHITDAEGNVDSTFSGDILLTVYDSPRTLVNLAPASSTPHASTITECEIDQEIIGEYYGTVEQGHFTINFRGPRSVRPGSHRLQAYAYSHDDAYRALGVTTALMEEAEVADEPSETLPPVINDFKVGDGQPDSYHVGNPIITAEIHIPAGFADASPALNPVRLIIDGVTYTNLRRQLVPMGNNTFALSYQLAEITGGSHNASLHVIDANGEIADAYTTFAIDNSPTATLAAEVDDEGVNFTLECLKAEGANKAMLIIENLFGDTIKYVPFENNSTSIYVNDLKTGAYRAYVQLSGDTFATATPKVIVIIN